MRLKMGRVSIGPDGGLMRDTDVGLPLSVSANPVLSVQTVAGAKC